MSTATAPIPTNVSSSEILKQLAAHGIRFFKPEEIERYIAQHPSLGILLPAICMRARAAFGSPTELLMKVYHDPEIKDCYLSIYIRQDRYEAGILERIDAVMAEFEPQLESASGFLLLTTDFRRPGERDVI